MVPGSSFMDGSHSFYYEYHGKPGTRCTQGRLVIIYRQGGVLCEIKEA